MLLSLYPADCAILVLFSSDLLHSFPLPPTLGDPIHDGPFSSPLPLPLPHPFASFVALHSLPIHIPTHGAQTRMPHHRTTIDEPALYFTCSFPLPSHTKSLFLYRALFQSPRVA